MKLTHEMCNEQFAKADIDTKRWIVLVLAEIESAEEKHPTWPKDHIHAAAIVGEESGELLQAAIQHKYEKGQFWKMHSEAIQIAAMALRFMKNTVLKKTMPGEIKDREPKFQKGIKK